MAHSPHGRGRPLPPGSANDADGLATLVTRLHERQPALVVLEASGGYERPLAATLSGAGLPVAVINPRQARDFAKATGQLAKTDTLDARALAHFAEAVRPPARPVLSAAAAALGAVLARRRQLVEMLTAERNRLHTAAAEVAALAGVAPLNCDSGTRRGKRMVWGGRAQLRAALYMGTLAAARFNPTIKAFYGRLCVAGKPKKLALTACMRKLLTILNAMLALQAWLGHRSPASTQHYARISPTKLAQSYQDAGYFGRNVRAVEVLID